MTILKSLIPLDLTWRNIYCLCFISHLQIYLHLCIQIHQLPMAIAKAKDLRQNDEALGNLLNNFINTINDLWSGVIELDLHGHSHVIQSDLIPIPSDSLASSWLVVVVDGVAGGRGSKKAQVLHNAAVERVMPQLVMKTTFRDTLYHRESNTPRQMWGPQPIIAPK